MTAPLDARDLASVARAEAATGHPGRTLNSWTDAWRELVEQVEAGYEESLHDYADQLGCRGVLARAWPLLTPRVRAAREDELAVLDERFRAATVDVDDAGVHGWPFTAGPEEWWRRRVPVVRGGDLAGGVDRLGRPGA